MHLGPKRRHDRLGHGLTTPATALLGVNGMMPACGRELHFSHSDQNHVIPRPALGGGKTAGKLSIRRGIRSKAFGAPEPEAARAPPAWKSVTKGSSS